MVDRTLHVPGLHSARDLGGLPLTGGGTTPAGVFVRSEGPDLVTAEGWEQLRMHGVRTVIDLRRPDERAVDGSIRPAWVTVLHLDLHDPVFAERFGDGGLDGAALHYLDRLEESPAAVVEVLGAISDAEPEEVRGIAVTAQGRRDKELINIEERRDGRGNPYFWIGFTRTAYVPGNGTDLKAILDGQISVTPLKIDLTDEPTMTLFAQAFAERKNG